LNYGGKFDADVMGPHSNAHFQFDSLSQPGDANTVTIPDAHLLFSGDYQRSGADLIVSDRDHRVVVPDYFHGAKRPTLVSPDGAQLDPKVIEALTGHVAYAQAAGTASAAKVVGQVVKMTGSASIVRNGVTIDVNNGDNVYQNDVVQTGSGSTLGLVLIDGTTFNLTANARLMLNDLVYEANSTSNTSLFTLVQGAASFVAGQVAKTGDMKVATPVAAIGIRGTAVILDISSTDGTVSISVVDQQDSQVHAVQVFNTRGDLIGTVTSNGSTLTLTPTATFEVIARESNKTPAQVAQEFNAFQQVLNTYDAGKQLAPNTPPPTDGKRGDVDTKSTTKFAAGSAPSSPSDTPPPTLSEKVGGDTRNPAITAIADALAGNQPTSTAPTSTSTSSNSSSSLQPLPIIVINDLITPPGNVDVPAITIPPPIVVPLPPVTKISSGAGDHFGPVISADGRFVTYDPDGAIYLYDRQSNSTATIASPGNGFTYSAPTISSDGRYIVYQGSNGSQSFVFVYGNDPSDPAHYQKQIQLVAGGSPAISGDGSRIVVENGGSSVGIYDLQGHAIAIITPLAIGVSGTVWKPAISADGHVVAFWNSDSATAGGAGQLFTYDLSSGNITAIASTATGAGTSAASFSADGHYVVYQSDVGGHSVIYLYDLTAGQVVFSTANLAGSNYNPVISPDGHFIVFASDAKLTADDTNSFADTYVVDVTHPSDPVFKLVSALADGTPGDAASNLGASISAGGLFVAFGSSASNLSTSGGGSGNIFVVDPTSGRSAIIQETASSPDILTATGVIALSGEHSGVTISVSDTSGKFTAVFDSDGNIQWKFSEQKTDFGTLAYGQDLSQQFVITLTGSGNTTIIPVIVTVHNAVQPVITAANAAPVIHDANLTVSEGGTVLLSPSDIGITDLNDSSFTFKVTNVTHGMFQVLVNGTWYNTATFTSAELAAGQVRFMHDGGEAAPTFSIQADDGETLNHRSNVLAGTVHFTNVNDAPVIKAASLVAPPGGTMVLSPSDITHTDSFLDFSGFQTRPDLYAFSGDSMVLSSIVLFAPLTSSIVSINDPDSSSFTFTLSNVTHGVFQTTADGTTWTDATTFTSADLNAGHVRFVRENSASTPTFSIQADDGASGLSSVFAGTVESPFIINNPPVITAASLTVSEGGTVLVAPADIGVSDPDSSSFTFTVTNVSNGTFQTTTDDINWVNATTFTTADLTVSHVRFVHDGGEAAPTFSIQANDGAAFNNVSNVFDGSVSFTNVNDAPQVIFASLAVAQGGTAPFTASVLVADPDSSTFTFTVSNVSHGTFQTTSDGVTWVDTTTFTSADMSAGHVRFAQDGSSFTPTFSIQADDGSALNNLSNGFVGSVGLAPGIPEVIYGDVHNNTLTGTAGNDVFVGGDGNDAINGLTGVDRAVYTDATGGITVDLAAGTVTGAGVGTDTLIGIETVQGSYYVDHYSAAGFTGNSGVPGVPAGFNSFEGMAGDDIIVGNVNVQGQILTRISCLSATAAVTVDFAAGIATGDSSVGTDHFTNVNAVIGSGFGDTLLGSDNPNGTYEQYEGRGGNDTIDGRGGYDFAVYNNDPATTSGITVNLAAAINNVIGDASIGSDTFHSVEAVRGTNFADTYDATNFGAPGFLNPATHNVGSLGTFNNFDGAGGNDSIFGNGNTRIQYSNATAAVLVDLAYTGTGGTGVALDKADAINHTSFDLASVGVDTIHGGVNAVMGSMFGDSLFGSANNENFQGLAGDDFIDGRVGFDTAQYNNMTYTTGGISVDFVHGIVTGDPSSGTDTLRSIEAIQGTYFADTFDATNFGAADFLDPAVNNVGNNGTFNQFEGMGGDDTITGNGNTRIAFYNASAGVTVDLAAGTAQGTAAGDAALVGHDHITGGVNSVGGSQFDDIISGDVNNNTLDAQGGNDTINGGGGSDTIIGGPGDDVIDGGTGADMAVFTGQRSAYTITTPTAGVTQVADSVVGRDGADTLTNVEVLQFSDGFDLLASGSSGSPVDVSGLNFTGNGAPLIARTGSNDDFLTIGQNLFGHTIDLGAGTGDTVNLGVAGGYTLKLLDVENLTGSAGDDFVVLQNTVSGLSVDLGAGNDSLTLANGSNSVSLSGVENINSSDFAPATSSDDTLKLLNEVTGLSVNLNNGTNTLNLAAGVNSLGNVFNVGSINGTSSADTLTLAGQVGNLTGVKVDLGSGNDTLNLGAGSFGVTFVYADNGGADVVSGFNNFNGDKIDLTGVSGVHSLADVQNIAAPNGTDTIITFSPGNTLTLTGILPADLVDSDFVFAGTDAPVITAASLTVSEGGTVPVTAASIGVTDPDSSSFTFTVTNVSHGTFQTTTDGVTWVNATTFTTADLTASHVRFVHDGGEAAPTFSIQANDGANLSNIFAGSISFSNVNDAPVITAASLTVSEGGTVPVTAASIGVTDPDSSSFTFTVTNVSHGSFQTTTDGVIWVNATTFTSADLTASHVRFVHDGGEAAPTFSIQANDGAAANNLSNVFAGSISFSNVNDAPVITAASLTVSEGGTVPVTAASIGVTDPDSSSFTFTVTNISHGSFQTTTNGVIWVNATTFTSADLTASHVRFVHDGGETAPTFSIQADDGAAVNNLSSVFAGSVSFTNVNDPPTGLVTISGTAQENQVLTASNTLADADGLGTISYQWQRGGVNINGATGTTYMLVNADVGHTIDVVAKYTDLGGTPESVASAQTTSVAAVGVIIGDSGNNTLVGTAGNDVFQGFGGDDSIDGLAGRDIADYSYATGPTGINVDMASGTVTGNGSVGTDTLRSIESVRGTDFADTYVATGFNQTSPNNAQDIQIQSNINNTFEGGGGNDSITGSSGTQASYSTGDGGTQISYIHALDGVTVDLRAGSGYGTAASDIAHVGTDTFTKVSAVVGSNYDDLLYGTDSLVHTDVFFGGRGNDRMDGRDGYDFVSYSYFFDPSVITGGISVDLAAGTVTGNSSVGTDTLISIESIRGTQFHDVYSAVGYHDDTNAGSNGTFNQFEGMGGDDTITGNGNTRIDYNFALAAVTVDLAAGTAHSTVADDADVGNDTILGGVNAVRGSSFNDSLSGSGRNENFLGGYGDDLADGGGGFDRAVYNTITDDAITSGITVNLAHGTVDGDPSVGHDTLRSIEAVQGTDLADIYVATGFTTTATVTNPNAGSSGANGSGAAFNEFEGGAGDDSITGNGNTRIAFYNALAGITVTFDLNSWTSAASGATGNASGDASVGHDNNFSGVNAVAGSAYDDTLTGANNPDNTTEEFAGRGGNDFIDGKGGFDRAYYSDDGLAAFGIHVDMASGVVFGDAAIGTDALRSIEAIRGTRFADTYVATGFTGSGAPTPSANSGNAGFNGSSSDFNEFEGLGGNDTITGNGNTRVSYANATAAVTVDLGLGTARDSADALNGTTFDLASVGIDSFTAVNRVRGSNFADTIFGDANANTLEGLGGNDRLDGKAGNDTLTGGNGADAFVYADGGGADNITDFNRGQGDKIDVSGVTGIYTFADIQSKITSSVGTSPTIIDFGGGNILTLINVTSLQQSDFVFADQAPSITGDLAVVAVKGGGVQITGLATPTTTADLQGVDPDNTPGQLTYTVTGVSHGHIAASATGPAITSFTQAQINSGSVFFVAGTLNTDGTPYAGQGSFTVSLSDGVAGTPSATMTVGVTIVDAQFTVVTPSGYNFDQDNAIVAMGSAPVSGVTPTSFTILNADANRDFTFTGTGFVYDPLTNAFTAGTISSILETTHVSPAPLASFDLNVSVVDWMNAVIDKANGGRVIESLTKPWTFNFIGDAGNDGFAASDLNDIFTGRAGNDTLDGQFGYDRANYGAAAGPINVQLADGIVTGDPSVGTDTLRSIELVTGSNFADTFNAGQTISNLAGFSSTSTNAGSMVTANVAGQFNEFEGRGGDDTITGNGVTRISYLHATAGVTVTFDIHSWDGIVTPGAPGNFNPNGGASGTAVGDASTGTDHFTGVYSVRGTNFNDAFHGSNNPFGTNENFEGMGGDDLIDGGGGFDRAVYNFTHDDIGVDVELAAGTVIDRPGGTEVGHDTLLSVEAIWGTEFADIYNAAGFTTTATLANPNAGSAGANLSGAAFNEFEGGGGDDIITGNGNTRVAYYHATGGVVVTLGPNGSGTADGNASVGHDVFNQGPIGVGSVNAVRGSEFNDIITGNNGGNTLEGQGGNDVLDGKGGNDNLTGGTGSDIFVYAPGGGADIITDFHHGEADRIDLRAFAGIHTLADVPAIASGVSSTLINFGSGNTLTLNGVVPASLQASDFIFANSVGPSVSVTVQTPDGYDFGTLYNDMAATNPIQSANDGTHFFAVDAIKGITFEMIGTFTYGPTPNQPTGGVITEIDILDTTNLAQTTQDHVLVNTNGWNINVGDFFNAIGAYAANNNNTALLNGIFNGATYSIVGSAGFADNNSQPHDGADVFFGGDHADVFNGMPGPFGFGPQLDPGNDTVDYSHAAAGVTVNLQTGATTGAAAAGDVFISIENLRGTNFDDILTGDGSNNVLEGGTGTNTLDGGNGFDTASYEHAAGPVTVSLAASGPQPTGGAGLDTLVNIEGLRGSSFDDTLTGNGSSVLEGGAGNDHLVGQSGDTASYQHATSAVTVNLALASQQDTRGAGLDTLTNIVNLTGSQFNDTLTGDTHNNTLFGNGGNDTFSFNTMALGGIGQDTIGDFMSGQDHIQLDYAAFTANSFSAWLTDHVTTANSGSDILIDLHLNNLTGHDTILLKNASVGGLHASDFILSA
jgi:Ca2+-binding RTX toxin-like protein